MYVCVSMHSQIQNIQNTYIYSHIHMSIHILTYTHAHMSLPHIHVYTYTFVHMPFLLIKSEEKQRDF